MGVIKKVYAGGTTHPFKDTVSGYGVFSATQTMPSTTSGATLVATVSYKSMLPTGSFGSTTNVNFYATDGSQTGNDWVATVNGIDLWLNSQGVTPPTGPTMPDLSDKNTLFAVINALKDAGIVTINTGSSGGLSGGILLNQTLTANYNINISYYVTTQDEAKSLILLAGETIDYADEFGPSSSFIQSPIAGTVLSPNSQIIAQQTDPHANDILLGTMPSGNISASDLYSAGILSKSGSTYTVLNNKITIKKKTGTTTTTYYTYSQGDICSNDPWTTTPNSARYPYWTGTTYSPAAGRKVYDVTNISITYEFGTTNPVG